MADLQGMCSKEQRERRRRRVQRKHSMLPPRREERERERRERRERRVKRVGYKENNNAVIRRPCVCNSYLHVDVTVLCAYARGPLWQIESSLGSVAIIAGHMHACVHYA